MSRLRYNRRRAVEHLSAACPALGRFIDGCGPLRLKVSADDGVFGALSRAIVYQQLSGRAAATIYGRFADLFEDGRPVPAGVLHLDFEELRGAGLSNNKALAVLDRTVGSLPVREIPRGVTTVEPPQRGERRAVMGEKRLVRGDDVLARL